ncbi:hypothetical protein [Methylobacterium sp. WSM2598]|uniref:hypothetical protein n=1 Tax=Methylobacterium sp. WSM2598 TaxID=398261 RepID=UPI00039ED52E|nr:hypothetical protein [Methylobacterium sp. WSM2598]
MPVKRRSSKVRDHRITAEAVEAFEAGDYLRLHAALGLGPHEASPLPEAVDGLGVGDGPPPPWGNAFSASWTQAQELQRELLAAGARMPKRRKAKAD